MTLGEKIVKRREKMGLSQTAFAKLAGVDATMLSCIESGARDNPTLRTVAKIAAALGISVSSLLAKVDTRAASGDTPKG